MTSSVSLPPEKFLMSFFDNFFFLPPDKRARVLGLPARPTHTLARGWAMEGGAVRHPRAVAHRAWRGHAAGHGAGFDE